MAKTEIQSESPHALSQWLADGLELALADRLQLVRGVAERVRQLHDSGQTHRAIGVDTVRVGERVEPQLDPPAKPGHFGGAGADPELCPPELLTGDGVELPAAIDAATAALQKSGYAIDPRRIDIYQLGTLLCRLLTGESVLGYMYDPTVKARVPAVARAALERALGEGDPAAIETCDELIAVLSDAARQAAAADSSPGQRDTPPWGTAIADKGDTPRTGHRPAPDTGEESLPFEQLGPYRITGHIGSGGMGDVYRGSDPSLDREVAIKVLPPELARDADFVRRFQAEAAGAAKLTHPNIVPVYFIGEDAGYHFFVMRFIEGEPLSARLAREGRLGLDDALRLIEPCLDGLAAAHEANLIHRDIKPGNILIDRKTGQPVLVDFGLVRRVGQQTQMTATGMVMGTVDYMAPEQARGHKVDCRADIYAVGVLLYQLLAGRLPFEAETPTGMMFQHAYEEPFPLQEAVPDLPQPMIEITARLMAKDREQRYATCADVLADIEAFREGRALAPAPEQDGSRSRQTSGPKSCDSGYEEGGPTSEWAAADDVQLPADLDELADDSPLQRVRDFAATLFRRHAPDFVQNLQGTTQQVDGAVGHYERRRNRLAKLQAEATAIAADLAEQLEAGRQALAAADETAESAESEAEREQALATKQKGEEDVEALQRQLDAQQGQVDEIEHELTKADATLARLKSQRDVLAARLKSAEARQQLEGGLSRARRRPWLLPTAVIGGCLLVAVPIILFLALWRPSAPPMTPEALPPAEVTTMAPGPVDLLSLIDIARDTVQGEWQRDGQTLLADPSSVRHVLQLPFQPPEEYDLEIDAEYVSDEREFSAGLVVGGTRGLVYLDGNLGNSSGISGTAAKHEGRVITTGQPFTIRCEVRRSGSDYAVRVVHNDRQIVSWQGDPAQLHTGNAFCWYTRPADDRVPFLRVKRSGYRLSRIELTPLSGSGQPVFFDDPSATPDRIAAERVLWKGGTVWVSEAGQPVSRARHVDELPPVFSLKRVAFNLRTPYASADLKSLAHLSALEELDLADNPVTDENLHYVTGLPKLRTLNLRLTQITDVGLAKLARCRGLRCLLLDGTDITDEGLRQVARLTGLEELHLRHTTVSDAGRQHLQTLQNLNRLVLDYTPVTDAGLAPLQGLAKLTHLSLIGAGITDAALPELGQVGSLSKLCLYGTGVTPAGIGVLRGTLPDCVVKHETSGPIDLLEIIDPYWGRVQGDWRFEADGLVSSHAGCDRIQIPFVPPEEYVLEVTAQRLGDDGLALGLVAGGRQFVLALDRTPRGGYLSGIDQLKTPSGSNDAFINGEVFSADRPVSVTVQVTKSGLSLSRDGQTLLDWTGDFSRCRLFSGWSVPGKDLLFLGSMDPWKITKMQLTPISGTGRVVRLTRKPAVSEPAGDKLPNLLDWVDVSRHTVSGDWTRNGNDLVSTPADTQLLQVPVEIRGSYRLDTVFTCSKGSGLVAVVLPVGDYACSVLLSANDGSGGGIERIDGKNMAANGTARRPSRLETGRPYTLTCQVELHAKEADIQVLLDGELFTQWRGDPSRLSTVPHRTLPQSGCVGLFSHGIQATFHGVQLKMLDSPQVADAGFLLQGHPRSAVRIGDHGYVVFEGNTTWHEAQARCQQLGGYLACLETPEESAAIGELLGGRSSIWIGAHKREDGIWYWVNGQPITAFEWGPGAPSNSGGVENRVELMPKGWNDIRADSENNKGFLCEWEPR